MDLKTKFQEHIAKPISDTENPTRLILGVVITALILGTLTGYIMSTKSGGSLKPSALSVGTPKSAQQDTRTFKDFAEGIIKVKPLPTKGEYTEGTHMLIRESAVPVALTSSVVDLSQYEGKKVKVFGETQKALKEGWLMDVGKVEEIK
ncbi:MAG: hypothetical protein PHE48_01685 [Candidatus Daviesbacteria bacterium]|nr:hypothetical protein [Candidatus Daviesbacteria bacterium]